MTTNPDQKTIQIALTKIYEVLKFTPDEAKNTLNDLTAIQQLAATNVLLNELTESEAAELSDDFGSRPEAERINAIEVISKTHEADPEFKKRVQAAAKEELDKHVVYLKTRGDVIQKEEIAKILAEIGY